MKYYHWVEHGSFYRAYYNTGVMIIDVEMDNDNGDKYWKEAYCLSQTAIRGCLNLSKIDPDVARLGEG